MNRQLRRHPVRQQSAKQAQAPARLPKLAPQAARPDQGWKGLVRPYWMQDILSELRKVTWPTRQEAWNLTIVVIVISAAMGLLLGGTDVFFSWLIEHILF